MSFFYQVQNLYENAIFGFPLDLVPKIPAKGCPNRISLRDVLELLYVEVLYVEVFPDDIEPVFFGGGASARAGRAFAAATARFAAG
jgi:hypothetical protein